MCSLSNIGHSLIFLETNFHMYKPKKLTFYTLFSIPQICNFDSIQFNLMKTSLNLNHFTKREIGKLCHPMLKVKEAVIYSAGTYQFNSLESAPLGTHLGRIKAIDPDMGENAELEYSISEGEGSDMFDVITDKDTQEGIITVKQVSLACLSSFSSAL